MNSSSYRRSSTFNVNRYSQNAVLQLIIITGICYCLFQAVRVTMIVYGQNPATAQNMILPLVALPATNSFLHHFWTILSYGFFHNGFMEWVSNAIWLFVFGNVVQNLVGYKQVIPTFLYGAIAGGAFCLLAQLIPGLPTINPVMTSLGGIMALAAACVTLAPKYRFYLGENFSIPLLVVVAIFLIIKLLPFTNQIPMIALCIGGLVCGWGMMKLVKKGYQPGGWIYGISGALDSSVTPLAERKHQASNPSSHQSIARKESQKDDSPTVDEILDKINQKGYNSLSNREREILVKASQETKG
ncbi:MAG: rhomboid family intramembrane serine protease [Bacteroidetes bacterium]|nr:rhomboid family intramembrane serine protease [Bacteroidota bacterium]